MANCAPCLKLGLQVVAHYDADRSSGKEAECYYHHFNMPLPKSLIEKIAQPKAVSDDQPHVDAETEGCPNAPRLTSIKATAADRLSSRQHGSVSGKRGEINPDVCAECWKHGHVCPPHCTVDGERLCIDCADGKPCAHDRAKEKDPKPRAHERYRVKLPGVKKPRAADVALVTNDQGSIIGVKRTAPPQPNAAVSRPLVSEAKRADAFALQRGPQRTGASALQEAAAKPPQVAQVSTAGKDLQKEESTAMKPPRICQCTPGCTEIAKSNASPYAKGHNPNLKNKTARPAARRSKASPPRKTNAKPAQPANGVATICVREEHLDNFWKKLPLEEKVNIFQRQLEGA